MTRCIALLRGINVGRAKRIAMADLRRLVESLGHTEVQTLLNSGNVVFEAKRAVPTRLATALSAEIARGLGLEVPVVVLSAAELDAAIERNPLLAQAVDASRHLLAFAGESAALDPARALLARPWAPDALAVDGRVAYLWCAAGVLDSPLSQAFARATGSAATARNWATVLKLQAAARA